MASASQWHYPVPKNGIMNPTLIFSLHAGCVSGKFPQNWHLTVRKSWCLRHNSIVICSAFAGIFFVWKWVKIFSKPYLSRGEKFQRPNEFPYRLASDQSGTKEIYKKCCDVCFSMVSFNVGVSLSLSHTHLGLPWGLILTFRRASPSLSYGGSPLSPPSPQPPGWRHLLFP